MRLTICRLIAASSLLAAWQVAGAEGRPRYGGTLRVEIREAVRSLVPTESPVTAGEAKEKLVSLIFETLVRLDDSGQPKPALAVSWQNDSESKRWRFRLRPGVKLHDGSDLTSEMVAASLRLGFEGLRASAVGNDLTVETDQPMPDLLTELAQASRSIFVRGSDLKDQGTGPFRVSQWEPGRRAVLVANEQHWAGRPFLDGITIEMGRPLREQSLDLELGKADFVEIWPNDVRRAAQRGAKIWSSASHILVALSFEPGRPAATNPRLREAIALSIDRAAMHNVLLQRQGEPAWALLPQRLSGYAYLFNSGPDPKKAQQLIASLGQPVPPLMLACDSSDPLARSLAERLSVDARETGVRLQVSAQSAAPDLRLLRLPLKAPLPGPALAGIYAVLHPAGSPPLPDTAALETVYASERAVIESYQVIPLFHLAETFGSIPKVKTWNTPGVTKSGAWCFEDFWLDQETP